MNATTPTAPQPTTPEVVAVVDGLRVALTARPIDIVEDVDLTLHRGEVVGLVGESGSGKTTAGTALLGYARSGAHICDGQITVAGHNIRALSPQELRAVRGVDVAYVPQDPSSALNPAIKIGKQLRELLDLHDLGAPQERSERIRDILPRVGLPSDDAFLARYPHQLSGGQVQRVALAMVFLARPKVLVLDEPTTGLDVTTQGLVLDTLAQLCAELDVAALYVTHDLAVVAAIADRVAVMYAGQIVELGPAREVFDSPAHPYTRALIRAIPNLHRPYTLTGIPGRIPAPGRRPRGCRFHDRCEFSIEECTQSNPPVASVSTLARSAPVEMKHDSVFSSEHTARCVRLADLPAWNPRDREVADTDPSGRHEVVLAVRDLNVYYGRAHVVHEVSFDLARREIVALVGESGSGKTTISRCVGGLHKQWDGVVDLEGRHLAPGSRARTTEDRKRIQYIFQNPYLSLNPRRTVEQILVRPMALFGIATGKQARERAAELLDSVRLGSSALALRAGSLSGGERQRVAIARALAAEPDVLVCDEITSALDVSIQGSIAELLIGIKNARGISMLFVTHDLPLVRSIADRVIVLQRGRLVESGLTAQVFEDPHAAYTQDLVSRTPTLP